MSVGTKIKAYRKKKQLTGAELAEMIGVTQGMISQYESDRVRMIPDDTLNKLADALECTVDQLISDDVRYKPDLVPGLEDHPDDSSYIEKFIHIYSKLPSNLKEAVNQCIAAFDSE